MTTNVSNSIGGNAYGDVVMAGGDAHVTRVSHGTDPLEALTHTRRLLRALEVLDLTPAARDAVVRDVAELEAELRRPQPDRERARSHLQRATEILKDAGALAAAGAALAGPIGAVAGALGGALTALR